jgi:threonine/homoserine/homoserine lactone efflux protein
LTEDIPSPKKAFLTGFLTNGLNVKATLFFVSLFSVIILPETPFAIKLGYGLYMPVAIATWFVLLSYLLTQTRVRSLLQIKGYLLDRIMGAVLLFLAIQLVLSDLN